MAKRPDHASTRHLLRDRVLWGRILQFARPYRSHFVKVTALGLAVTAAVVAFPFMFAALVNDLLGHRSTSTLFVPVGAILGLSAVMVWLRVAQARALGDVTGLIGADIGSAIFDRLQRQDAGFFGVSNPGAITSRTVDEVVFATLAFPEAANLLIGNLSTVLLTTVALLLIDWRSIGPILVLVGVMAAAQRLEGRYRRAALDDFRSQVDLKTYTAERMNADGNLLVKLHGDYGREQSGYRTRSLRLWEVRRTLLTLQTGITSVLMFGSVATIAVLLVILAVQGGKTNVGAVVAMVILLRSLELPLSQVAEHRLNIARSMISFARVFEVLDALPGSVPTSASNGNTPSRPAPRSRDHGTTQEPAPPRGRLAFDSVRYVYPRRSELAVVPTLSLATETSSENLPSLHDVSFVVEPGTKVALVGRSGAGKSTIARLAAGILRPTSGHVTIDGVAIPSHVGRQPNNLVAYVTQDTFLFHDTLRANILYTRPDASEDDLHAACVASGVHELAWDLPLRYETIIGENGARLSGGQRQRISLARALLRDPWLVILDEATAHLDPESEAIVHNALDEVFRRRSCLVIAHRLSMVRHADVIVVVDRGRVVEQGTHAELLAERGTYAELWTAHLADAQPAPTVVASP